MKYKIKEKRVYTIKRNEVGQRVSYTSKWCVRNECFLTKKQAEIFLNRLNEKRNAEKYICKIIAIGEDIYEVGNL